MKILNKIILIWLSVMWIIFSFWSFVITQFPLNLSVIGLESIAGIILIWTMQMHRDTQNVFKVPSDGTFDSAGFRALIQELVAKYKEV